MLRTLAAADRLGLANAPRDGLGAKRTSAAAPAFRGAVAAAGAASVSARLRLVPYGPSLSSAYSTQYPSPPTHTPTLVTRAACHALTPRAVYYGSILTYLAVHRTVRLRPRPTAVCDGTCLLALVYTAHHREQQLLLPLQRFECGPCASLQPPAPPHPLHGKGHSGLGCGRAQKAPGHCRL